MYRICSCLALVSLLSGCSGIAISESSTDERLRTYHPAAYDEKYKGTKHERQAFDESAWDKIEGELRERPR